MNRFTKPAAPETPSIAGVDFEIVTDHPQIDEHPRVFRAPQGKIFRIEGSFTVLLYASDDIMPYPASSRKRFLSSQSGREEFDEFHHEYADQRRQNVYDEWLWRNRHDKDFEWSRFEEWVEMNIRDQYVFQAYIYDHINDISHDQSKLEQVIIANAYDEQSIWDALQERYEREGRYEHFPDFFEGEWLHIEYAYDGIIVAVYRHDEAYAKYFRYWQESRRADGAVDWLEMNDYVIKDDCHIATFKPDREIASITLVDRISNTKSSRRTRGGAKETAPKTDDQLRNLSRIALNSTNEKDI